MTAPLRIYHKSDKEFRDVLSINFQKGYVIVDMGHADVNNTTRWDTLVEEHDYELLYYIGLEDSQGTPIYTGDILEVECDLTVVGEGIIKERIVIDGTIDSLTHLDEHMILGASYVIVSNIYEDKGE